jgi:hypothetical protein
LRAPPATPFIEAKEDVPGLDALAVLDLLSNDQTVNTRPDRDGSDRLNPADGAFDDRDVAAAGHGGDDRNTTGAAATSRRRLAALVSG